MADLRTQFDFVFGLSNQPPPAAAAAAAAAFEPGPVIKKQKRKKKKVAQAQARGRAAAASRPPVAPGFTGALAGEPYMSFPTAATVAAAFRQQQEVTVAGGKENRDFTTVAASSRKRKASSTSSPEQRPAKQARRYTNPQAFVTFVQKSKESMIPTSSLPPLHVHKNDLAAQATGAVAAADTVALDAPRQGLCSGDRDKPPGADLPLSICTQEHGVEDIDSTWPWNVFTDGSLLGKDQGGGYGVYYVWCKGGFGLAKHVGMSSKMCYDSKSSITGETKRLVELENKVFSALSMELLAILEAILIVQAIWGYSRLYVYTDSLAALKLLDEFQRKPSGFTNHVHRAVMASIVDAARQSYIKHIFLHKVKAHVGIFGNEAADKLAKMGAASPGTPFHKFNLTNLAHDPPDTGLVCIPIVTPCEEQQVSTASTAAACTSLSWRDRLAVETAAAVAAAAAAATASTQAAVSGAIHEMTCFLQAGALKQHQDGRQATCE